MKQQIIAEKIKLARQKANLTQGEFAKLIGYSPMAVSYLERGERGIKISTLEKIEKVLDIEITETVPFTHSKHKWEYIKTEYELSVRSSLTAPAKLYAYLMCQCGRVRRTEVEDAT